jgi:hypothetical protein
MVLTANTAGVASMVNTRTRPETIRFMSFSAKRVREKCEIVMRQTLEIRSSINP